MIITKTASKVVDFFWKIHYTSGERKVMMDARLEARPKSPRLEKITPSHQNSNCFHTWLYFSFRCSYYEKSNHTAPEIELLPHLCVKTSENQLLAHISCSKEHLHCFVGIFFSILDINWFARILDWTTSTLLSANFDVKDPFENLKIESSELFLKILRVASYCWKLLWKLVCHAY